MWKRLPLSLISHNCSSLSTIILSFRTQRHMVILTPCISDPLESATQLTQCARTHCPKAPRNEQMQQYLWSIMQLPTKTWKVFHTKTFGWNPVFVSTLNLCPWGLSHTPAITMASETSDRRSVICLCDRLLRRFFITVGYIQCVCFILKGGECQVWFLAIYTKS